MAMAPLAVALLGAPVARRDGEAAVVEAVRAMFAQINAEISAGRAEETWFASVDGGETWQPMQKGTPPEPRDDAGLVVAVLFLLQGTPAKAIIETTTPSGDWLNSAEYYFRRGGRTAFRFERHSTFYAPEGATGPVRLERRSYFDERGHRVRHLERATDAGGKEVPARRVPRPDFPEYARAGELPFPSSARPEQVNH